MYYFNNFHSGRGGDAGSVQTCRTCRGTGVEVHLRQIGIGFVQQSQTTCSNCHGAKEVIDPKHRCKNCNGKKVVREKKLLVVEIDKGMVVSGHSHMVNRFLG